MFLKVAADTVSQSTRDCKGRILTWTGHSSTLILFSKFRRTHLMQSYMAASFFSHWEAPNDTW